MLLWRNTNFLVLLFVFFLSFFFTGCENTPQYQDPLIKKTRKDFEDILSSPCGPCSTPCPVISAPLKEKLLPSGCHQKVSLSLSGQIPLSEAFYELAKQAKINIALDDPISKATSIIYQAHEQPFAEVLENLCDLGGLRYSVSNNTIHICEDCAYIKNHNVQFLLGSRKTQTQTTIKTDVFAQGLHSKGCPNTDNGTNISMNSDNSTDFWHELENNLTLILSKHGKRKGEASFSVNKYGGILTVCGSEHQQRMVESYLFQLRKFTTTQVLIEAKIIEVNLSKEYKDGINWNFFFGNKKHSARVSSPFGQLANPISPVPYALPVEREVFSFSVNTPNVSLIATFMEKFGTTRTIANPRLTVLNNQSALLKVARNEVFFELQYEDVVMTQVSALHKTESRIQTIPIGLILYVQPSVNFETGEVILALHPTLSRVVEYREDPAVQIASKDTAVSKIPVVQTREMDTVIIAKPDHVIITGGLMEEINQNAQTGFPKLSDIPLLGKLFKSENDERNVTELVILLKVTILDQQGLPAADQRLYRDFTQDPRPF